MFEQLLDIAKSVVLEYNKTIGKEIPKEDLVVASYKDMIGRVEFLLVPQKEDNLLYKVLYDIDSKKVMIVLYALQGDTVTFDITFDQEDEQKLTESVEAEIIEETKKSEE